ncbi:MAG: MarR family transcriptional regulator [Actinobacteria bacterium]|nr:MarR family transcriptional regulator [Actinomycetota bacterium]
MVAKPSRRASKSELVARLIAAFRAAGTQDGAIEELAARRLGISAMDLRFLNAIENAGGLTAGELARAVGVTTGAVTGALDRLEGAGFARRAPDPADRRRVRVAVTPEFRARAESIWGPIAAEWQRRLAARFTAAELETIVAFLELTGEIGGAQVERLAGGAGKPG